MKNDNLDFAIARTRAIAADTLCRLGFKVGPGNLARLKNETVRILPQGHLILGAPTGSRVYLIGDYWNRPDWPRQKELITSAKLRVTNISHPSAYSE